MVTATRMDRAEWERRALELARAAHLDGVATYLGTYTAGDGSHPVCWHVPSRDRSGRYTVECDHATGEIRCYCTAATYGRPCCHAGAVVHALRQRAQAYAGAESVTAMRWFALGGEWDR